MLCLKKNQLSCVSTVYYVQSAPFTSYLLCLWNLSLLSLLPDYSGPPLHHHKWMGFQIHIARRPARQVRICRQDQLWLQETCHLPATLFEDGHSASIPQRIASLQDTIPALNGTWQSGSPDLSSAVPGILHGPDFLRKYGYKKEAPE